MKPQLTCTLAIVLAIGAGCTRREDALTADASAGASADASTTAAELPPRTTDSAPPEQGSPAETATAPAEAPLPAWVPDAGRLTVVQAPDLARNLGMADAAVSPAADASTAR